MWKLLSICLDETVLSVSGAGRGPLLREGVPGEVEYAPLSQEARERPARISLPASLREPTRIPVTMPTIGEESFADFVPAPGGRAETLVLYHHGLSELPHDASARPILTRVARHGDVDWLALRGAHHASRRDVGEKLLRSEGTFGRGLFASISALRALAAALRPRYRHVVLAGMSLGGVITYLEAAEADASLFDLYVPLQAGPDLEAALFRSSFTRLVAKAHRARAEPGSLTRRLDLVSRLARTGAPIRPVLSRFDRLFPIEPQLQALSRIPRALPTVLSAGHITGALRFSTLASILRGHLTRELWSGRAGAHVPTPVPVPARGFAGAAAPALSAT